MGKRLRQSDKFLASSKNRPLEMTQYTIYKNPTDYPNKFVTRELLILPGDVKFIDPPAAIVDTLEQARAVIPNGFFKLPNHPDDDPIIVEIWI